MISRPSTRLRPLFRLLLPSLIFLLVMASLAAQKVKRDPLTPAEVEKIREAGIDPSERVKLYTEFISDHVNTVKNLTSRSKSAARSKRLDDELQNVTALMDELGANLDQYSDRHAEPSSSRQVASGKRSR